MASKKQQSRVAKAKRHGLGRHAYEYVMVDEEGNEIEVDEAESPSAGKVKRASGGAKGGSKSQPAQKRRVKEPQPPSLKRLGKRSALFVPLILLLTLSQKKVSVESRVIQAVIFLIVFVVLMWGSDHLVWKMWQKRQAKEAAARGGKPGGGRPGAGGKG